MHDLIIPVFSIKKNQSNYLNILQKSKATYWFKRYLDLYDNGHVDWKDIELLLTSYQKSATNPYMYPNFHEKTKTIWRFLQDTYRDQNTKEILKFSQFLDAWISLLDFIKKNDRLPDVFFEWFKSCFDLYEQNNYSNHFTGGYYMNINEPKFTKFRPMFTMWTMNSSNNVTIYDAVDLIKRLLISENVTDESYLLLPGLSKYLELNVPKSFNNTNNCSNGVNDANIKIENNGINSAKIEKNSSQINDQKDELKPKPQGIDALLNIIKSSQSVNNTANEGEVRIDIDCDASFIEDLVKKINEEAEKENTLKRSMQIEASKQIHKVQLTPSLAKELNIDDQLNTFKGKRTVTYTLAEWNEFADAVYMNQKTQKKIKKDPKKALKDNFMHEFKKSLRRLIRSKLSRTDIRQEFKKTHNGFHYLQDDSNENQSVRNRKKKSFAPNDIRREFKNSHLMDLYYNSDKTVTDTENQNLDPSKKIIREFKKSFLRKNRQKKTTSNEFITNFENNVESPNSFSNTESFTGTDVTASTLSTQSVTQSSGTETSQLIDNNKKKENSDSGDMIIDGSLLPKLDISALEQNELKNLKTIIQDEVKECLQVHESKDDRKKHFENILSKIKRDQNDSKSDLENENSSKFGSSPQTLSIEELSNDLNGFELKVTERIFVMLKPYVERLIKEEVEKYIYKLLSASD